MSNQSIALAETIGQAEVLRDHEPEAALRLYTQVCDQAQQPQQQLEVLRRMVELQQRLGQLEAALGNQERMVVLCEQHAPQELAEALLGLAKIERDLGEFAKAEDFLQRARTIAKKNKQPQVLANIFNALASIAVMGQGDFASALAHLGEMRSIYQKMGNRVGEANGLTNMGIVYTDLGDYAKALEHLLIANTLNETHNNAPSNKAFCLINIGVVYLRQHNFDQASENFLAALEIGKDANDTMIELHALSNLVEAQNENGQHTEAKTTCARVLEIATSMGETTLYEIDARIALGQAMRRSNDLADAKHEHQRALELAKHIGNHENQMNALYELGLNAQAEGEPQQASQYFRAAFEIAFQLGHKKKIFLIQAALAKSEAQQNHWQEAYTQLRESHKLEREVFSEENERRTSNLEASFERDRAKAQAENYRVREETAKQLAVVAESANKAKSDFLSRMSHELRTPLNAILGFAQLLQGAGLQGENREGADHIARAGRHLLDLINEVLDIARIEAGRIDMNLTALDVHDAIASCLELVRPLAMQRNIEIVFPKASGAVFVRGDEQRFKQIIINLLSNAIKYNRENGQVQVRLEQSATLSWRIGIADTGLGLTAAQMAKLFVPFERLGAEHGRVEGTGIGLSLVKLLAEAMQGQLQVESTPGQGSVFWLELPHSQAPEQPPMLAVANPQTKQLGNEAATVVYIEDNAMNIKLVQMVLAKQPSIKLVVANQGAEGLRLVQTHNPNVVLLDLDLPDMRGEEVLAKLRTTGNTVPVVILSAEANPGTIDKLLTAGAQAYLTKPLELKRFLDVLNNLLQR